MESSYLLHLAEAGVFLLLSAVHRHMLRVARGAAAQYAVQKGVAGMAARARDRTMIWPTLSSTRTNPSIFQSWKITLQPISWFFLAKYMAA